jgi:predicted Zn-dependent protease
MLQKLLAVLPVLLILALIFFHRAIPRRLRRLGSWLGNLGRAGRELVGTGEVEGSPLARYESQIGRALAARAFSARPLSTELALQERVARLGHRLSALARRRDILYRFAAVEDAEPTAVALPGGTVLVSTAMAARFAADDGALLALLAHEFAHVERRDAIRAFAAQTAARRGLRWLGLGGRLFGLGDELLRALESQLDQGYSEETELAADRDARELLAATGESADGLQRLLQALELPPLALCAYAQRHPSSARRLRALDLAAVARREKG